MENVGFKKVRPIVLDPQVEERVRRQIISTLFEMIFAPVIETITKDTQIYFNSILLNGFNKLASAIRAGKVYYSDNVFYGSFSAGVSKELIELGAKYNKRLGGFAINMALLPFQIISAIASSKVNFEKMQKGVLSQIDNLNFEKKIDEFDFTPAYKEALDNVDKQFDEKTNRILNIPNHLSSKSQESIAQEYSQNLKLYIKKFADEEVLRLRKDVEANVFIGYRAEKLRKVIKENYDVSDRKAKFLARQETSLLTSKYSELRYKEAGVTEYEWSGVDDSRERADHKKLNGKIFRFDSPPIVDEATGKRANPGEDFNCRCRAIPIIKY